ARGELAERVQVELEPEELLDDRADAVVEGFDEHTAGRGLEADLASPDHSVHAALAPEVRAVGAEGAKALGRELEVVRVGEAEERQVIILPMHEPPLLGRALELARELGFERSSLPEVGRLLRALASGRFRIAEIGTGTGVGAAWIADALAPGAVFVTVEADPERAEAAARLLEH